MKPTLPGIDEIRVVSAAGKSVVISSDDVAVEVMQDFAKALDAIERIDTDSEADAGKYQYKYASLPHVLAEVKRVCQLFGFSVSQTPSGTLDGLVVTVSTMLIHHRTGATLWRIAPPISGSGQREAWVSSGPAPQ